MRSPQPRRKACKQSSLRSPKPALATQHHVQVHVDLEHRRAVAPRPSPSHAGPEHHEEHHEERAGDDEEGEQEDEQQKVEQQQEQQGEVQVEPQALPSHDESIAHRR